LKNHPLCEKCHYRNVPCSWLRHGIVECCPRVEAEEMNNPRPRNDDVDHITEPATMPVERPEGTFPALTPQKIQEGVHRP
jgi:hypothetical protein